MKPRFTRPCELVAARGQIIVMYTLILPVLLLAMSFAVDFGYAYVARTRLSRAVDAAALSAMRNINLGNARAIEIARNAFNVNYGSAPGGDVTPPTVSIVITTDGSNNTVVNVDGTATINTVFLRLIPGFRGLNLASHAQVTRPKLIMALVLDKSGSMNRNGGAQALPPAVTSFVGYFDNLNDRVAMVSFSSVSSVDVTMRTNFRAAITAAVGGMGFVGATYASGGMQDGFTQITNVPTAPGENVVKVAVFFTDGWANTVQDNLNCPPSTKLNFGGCAPPEAAVGWCSGVSFLDPVNGNSRSCGATTFPSQVAGGPQPLTQQNISNDAMYRALQVANNMRAQNIVVYSIGLGDKISQPFLQQIANDPASAGFDPAQPVGKAVFAPTAADLQAVFQVIASKILMRLSQ